MAQMRSGANWDMVPGIAYHNVRTMGPSTIVEDSLQYRTMDVLIQPGYGILGRFRRPVFKMICRQLVHLSLIHLRFRTATHSTDSRNVSRGRGKQAPRCGVGSGICMGFPAGTKRPQSVEQMALDNKVTAQERVEHEQAMRHGPYLPRCIHVPTT